MPELPQQAAEDGVNRLREAGVLEGSSTAPEGDLCYPGREALGSISLHGGCASS